MDRGSSERVTATARTRRGRGLDARASAGELFSRSWWAIALRGAFAVLLGLVVLAQPRMATGFFVAVVGGYLFLDGVFTMTATFHAAGDGQSWWPYLFEGLLSVAAGTFAFARPMEASFLIAAVLAVRALVMAAVEIGTGAAIREETGRSPWLLWLGGLASLAFGILLLAQPSATLLGFTRMVGVFTLAFGVMLEGEVLRGHGFGHGRLATTHAS